MKQTIIFLDFDGVLNSVRSAIAENHYVTALKAKRTMLMGGHGSGFDRVAVNLIYRLIEQTDGYVVVSSAWRKIMSLRDIRTMFHTEFGWPDGDDERIISMTGSSSTGFRGDEIQNWIDEHATGISNFRYIIIDDGGDFYDHQHKRLIQTDPYEGLLYRDYTKALHLFGLSVDPDKEWL